MVGTKPRFVPFLVYPSKAKARAGAKQFKKQTGKKIRVTKYPINNHKTGKPQYAVWTTRKKA